MIQSLALKPKRLFIIDGLGALLSAFLLGVVLVQWQSAIGIPTSTLYFLASMPIGFALSDMLAYFFATNHIASSLKGIAILNILYCVISLILVLSHLETVTLLGWSYIIIEVIIIITLVYLEFKVANSIK